MKWGKFTRAMCEISKLALDVVQKGRDGASLVRIPLSQFTEK